MSARIGLCTLDLYLPFAHSLKDKRSILKSLLSRSQKQFNISVAEVDHHDIIQSAQIAIATVSNSNTQCQRVLANVINWIENNMPEAVIARQAVELL